MGSSGEVDITSTDSTANITLLGTLPSGLSLSGSGDSLKITGTPDAGTSGNYGLEAKATNSTGSSYAFVSLLVLGPPLMTSASTAVFTEGTAGSFTITTNGKPRPGISTCGLVASRTQLHGQRRWHCHHQRNAQAGSSGDYTLNLELENLLGTPTPSLTVEVQKPPAFTSDRHCRFGEGGAGRLHRSRPRRQTSPLRN